MLTETLSQKKHETNCIYLDSRRWLHDDAVTKCIALMGSTILIHLVLQKNLLADMSKHWSSMQGISKWEFLVSLVRMSILQSMFTSIDSRWTYFEKATWVIVLGKRIKSFYSFYLKFFCTFSNEDHLHNTQWVTRIISNW